MTMEKENEKEAQRIYHHRCQMVFRPHLPNAHDWMKQAATELQLLEKKKNSQ